MKSLAVISNPASRRNRRSLDDIHAAIGDGEQISHHILNEFADLPDILNELAGRDIDILVINGGDGTVQATLTHLFNEHPDYRPMLCVLAGGTSNTIALDVGVRSDRAAALRRLIKLAGTSIPPSCLHKRAVLKVTSGSGPAHFGMLFGAAGITRGIRVHRKLFPWTWFPDSLATVLMLIVLAGSWIIRGSMARQILEGESVSIKIDGQSLPARHYAALLASTLDKIVLGADPFWGSGQGQVKLSGVVYPPKALIQNLRRFLFGPARDALPDSYCSWRGDEIELNLQGAFVLDGEFYDIQAGDSVRLSADERQCFIRP